MTLKTGLAFAATWWDLEILILSAVSERKSKLCGITSVWNLKCDTHKPPTDKTERRVDTENRLVVAKGGGSGTGRESGISRCNL